MLSIGLWRWYINIIITILDVFHEPLFYFKLSSTYRFVRTSQETQYVSGMSTTGLWWWYSNIIITILDIIYRPAFYLKHDDK
jgi:hypothetical protein